MSSKLQIRNIIRDGIRNDVMLAIITKFPFHSEYFVEKATCLFDIEIGECADSTVLDNKLQPDITNLLEKVSLCVTPTMSETRLNFSKYE